MPTLRFQKSVARHVTAAFLVLLSACTPGPAFQVRTLPGGKVLKVIGISDMASTDGKRWLKLDYQTDLPMSDIDALRRESDEIWFDYFKHEVDRAGASEAWIRAHSASTGVLLKKSSFLMFSYKKGPNGKWPGPGGQAKNEPSRETPGNSPR